MLRSIAATMGLLVVVSTSLAQAAPCAGFTDVDTSSPFCVNVEWMKNRGITLGLTPTLYDPNSPVTRLQMAAFMYRLGFHNAFLRDGNAFGATAVLGTTDNHAVDVLANGARVMRYEPNTISPNVIGGSWYNSVTAGVHGATIAGGDANMASGNWSTVAGGNDNTASGISSSVVGGSFNTASGDYSTVAGGSANTASGALAFAAGQRAVADQEGCFVFANWGSGGGSCLGTPRIARFLLDHGLSVDYFSRRADGGGTRWVHIGDLISGQTIATSNGAFLSNAGVWVNAASSREVKTAFAPVDALAILDKVAALSISTWRYREGEGEVRHIGPMAEDFHAAFDVGYGPHTISDLDARGVALAAIQGLNAKLEADRAAKDGEIAALRTELAAVRSVLAMIAVAQPTQTVVIGVR